MAGPDIDEQVDPQEWNEYVRKSQDSMRVLAEETGGLAVVNMNDFDKALKRIDAESSDYYVLGYYSSNPDPTKRRRKIEVKVLRDGMRRLLAQRILVLKPPPPPVSSSRKSPQARLSHPRRSPRGQRADALARLPSAAAASFRYVSSMSAPMKLTPSRAHATAVLPRPVNGSIAVSMRDRPCSRRHCSGRRDGNVAGCGRSRSRR